MLNSIFRKTVTTVLFLSATLLNLNISNAGASLNAPLPHAIRGDSVISSAPINVSITPMLNALVISWSAPADTGSEPIQSYTFTATSADSTEICSTSVLSCTIYGLNGGETYEVTGTAFNSVGNSAPSAPLSGTPWSLPDPPSNVTVTPGVHSILVQWDIPHSNGGTPIESYQVTATSDDGTHSFTCVTGSTSCKIGGLSPLWRLNVEVIADTAAGWSDVGAAQEAINAAPRAGGGVLPLAPIAVVGKKTELLAYGVPGNSIVAVSLSGITRGCKANAEGQCIIIETLRRTGLLAGTTMNLVQGKHHTLPPFVIRGSEASIAERTRQRGEPFSVSVVSGVPGSTASIFGPVGEVRSVHLSSEGFGSISVAASNLGWGSITVMDSGIVLLNMSVLTTSVPSSPSQPTVDGGNGSISVQWSPPASNGFLPIRKYIAYVGSNPMLSCTSGGTQCTIRGLPNNVNYRIRVKAENQDGASPPSAPSAVVHASKYAAAWNAWRRAAMPILQDMERQLIIYNYDASQLDVGMFTALNQLYLDNVEFGALPTSPSERANVAGGTLIGDVLYLSQSCSDAVQNYNYCLFGGGTTTLSDVVYYINLIDSIEL